MEDPTQNPLPSDPQQNPPTPPSNYPSQNPYGQNPYNQNPYGQNPYGQNPYNQNPYGQNPYGHPPHHPYTPYDAPKERHGCVTAWLILALFANSAIALVYFFMSHKIARLLPGNVSEGIIILLGVASLLNVVCAVLLFSWKKLGFYGFVVTSLIGVILNMYAGLGFGQSLAGLIGVGVLFGILQIKQNNVSTWENLE